jgi:tripartite ATP-independent transporter DctP family solute receptor
MPCIQSFAIPDGYRFFNKTKGKKKMKQFKLIAVVLCICIVLLSTIGCQKTDTTDVPGDASDVSDDTVSDDDQDDSQASDDTAASGEVVTIKFAHMNSPEDNVQKAAEKIKEGVESRTNGQVVIELYPSGQLGENKEVLEQARLGDNTMGQFGVGHLEEYVHNYSIFLYPFLFDDWSQAQTLVSSDLVKGWEEELETQHGIVVLGYANFGVRDLYTIDKPVRTPADCKGLKIRVQSVKMYTEMITAIGAAPTTLPWMEVYSALTQKVVDGAEAPPRSILDQKHNEAVKYLSMTDHMMDVVPFAIGAQTFNALTEEQQQILMEETQAACDWMTQANEEGRDAAIEEIEASGVEIIRDVDVDAFREATKEIYQAFPEWTEGLYNDVLEIIGR